MIYLILAIISSALVSITMRISESYIKNNMGMFTANYGVCLILAYIFMGQTSLLSVASESGISGDAPMGMVLAVGLGLLSGGLYLINFVLLQTSMRHNGIVLSSMFMKLGVLVPTLMAILIFRERPEALQIMGICLAIIAIVLVNLEKEAAGGVDALDGQEVAGRVDASGRQEAAGKATAVGSSRGSRKGWLMVLLLVSGFTDSMANIYDKTGVAALKEHYLFYTFLAALILAFVMAVKGKKKVVLWDVGFGVLIGIPNYFSARFLLLALGSVPAVIAYPVYSVAAIVVISVVSVVVFRETIGRRKLAALGLVALALGMLNV